MAKILVFKAGLYIDTILEVYYFFDGIDWFWMDNEFSWNKHILSPSPNSFVDADLKLLIAC